MLSLHQLLSVSALRAGVCEGVARDQMAASQLSLRGKRNEAAEGEPAAEAYYFGVEAAETLTNPDHGRSPTQSCMHASARAINTARLTASPLFPLPSPPPPMACACTVTHTGGISRCLIAIDAVGGAESEHRPLSNGGRS